MRSTKVKSHIQYTTNSQKEILSMYSTLEVAHAQTEVIWYAKMPLYLEELELENQHS